MYKDEKDLRSACDPIVTVGDLWDNQKYSMKTKQSTGVPKEKMPDSLPAIPCGLVAKSFFNDTFELYKFTTEPVDNIEPVMNIDPASGLSENIKIQDENIAWASDIEYKFKNIKEKFFKADSNFPTLKDKTF